MDQDFDVIVIGAGPAGEVCAARAANGGKKVAIIERERVGGECAFWACVPSKVLLRSLEPFKDAGRVPGSKAAVKGDPSFAEAAAWRTESVSGYDDAEHVPFLRDNNVSLLRGDASVEERGAVRVGDRVHRCQIVVIATGSDSQIPPIDGLQDGRYWTSREASAAGSVPKRLAILGAGAVGVELGQIFARYGSQVCIVESAPHVLPKEEPAIAAIMADALQQDGIALKLGKRASKVEWRADAATVTLQGGEEIQADQILVATGREPRLGNVNAEALGITIDKKAVRVDKQCRAGEDVYAIGDVTGVAMFTHVAKYQGRIAADAILGKAVEAAYNSVPRCVFTDPEVGAVGLTEQQARDAGIDCVTGAVPLTSVARANLFYERPVNGSIMLVADKAQRLLIGASIIGPAASEMTGLASSAIAGKVPIDILMQQMQPFPTFSEAFFSALESLKL